MKSPIVQAVEGVTLVGGGPVPTRDLARARARAPVVVAADGGANRLLPIRVQPQAVIGDLDSISDAARAAIPADRLHFLPDQATTDFDKALRSIEAPFILALGFAGARIDHGLAVMNTLVRHANRRCLVLGPRDLAFAAPPELHLQLRPGDPLSLFPLAPVRGESDGLDWPIAGLAFAPDGFIGTSNRVSTGPVRLAFDRPGMIVILPRNRLDAAITALRGPLPRPRPPGPGAPAAPGG
ncbi:thiamine diphosphokinase [Rhodobacter sp. Har01]|uniref:thiamine diphosphokinase n=1 Tax=Rhodobacter sp. Har01 TaxID=2883999 RepID=UPI001D06E011|nr:thiamine diphosphokinase [Rhodobacter sp. Har01]MCB6178858.1 thiamine diphosphokinase [Rhodobacter sp. Har01]